MKQFVCLAIFLFSFETTFSQVASDSSVNYIYPKSQSFKGAMAKLIIRSRGKHGLAKSFRKNDFDSVGTRIPEKMRDEFDVEITEVSGKPVYTFSPKGMNSNKIIFYLHGGAYVRNTVKQHWVLVGELVRKTGYSVVVPDYPLAPANTVAQVIPMVEKAYKNLLSKTKSSNIIFMGDSAGGGLALALAQKLKKDKQQLPQQLILLSPWLDVTMSNPEMKALESRDPMLDIEGSQLAGKAYAGKSDTKNYLVSPMYGDLTGLPKISLFTSGKDLLIVDVKKFRNMLEEEGIAVNYYEYPHLFHVWIAATFLRESQDALDQIAELVK